MLADGSSCGASATSVHQGVRVGYSDYYHWFLYEGVIGNQGANRMRFSYFVVMCVMEFYALRDAYL